MKTCKTCSLSEPQVRFYASSTTKCMECTKAAVRANRAKNSEYYRAYDRLRFYEHGHRGTASIEAQRRGKRAWYTSNPEKKKCHAQVKMAVSAGKLIKPLLCESCKNQRPLHGHHDDYSKPLEVRWLCSPCHRAWHRKYDEAETRAIVEQKRNAT